MNVIIKVIPLILFHCCIFKIENVVCHGGSAVVANGKECAGIGANILKQNGSAADAAIATLFCEGVACPQSMGLGGGFLLTIYTRATKTIETLQARETAPIKSTQNMFVNRTISGGISVAVPGELKGYWELHQRFGKLPWSELVQPTIDLCRNGIEVTPYLARIIQTRTDIIKNSPSLAEIFLDPLTNVVWKAGDKIKRLQLANTLEIIANEGAAAIYNNGTLAQNLVSDIQEFGGIITIEDFLNYQVRWEKPIKTNLKNNLTMYTGQLPGAGIILTFIMNVLNEFVDQDSPVAYQRLIETFKYAYAQRTKLGDIHFVDAIDEISRNLTDPLYAEYIRSLIYDDKTFQEIQHYGADFSLVEDHGTAHISVLASNGDAVSVTSSINTGFGARIRSRSTGIILNDEMDDFSTPGNINKYGVRASPVNYIKPGKRPLSSMCPTILINNNNDNAELIIGAAGGTIITTSIAYVMMRHLWFNESLSDAVAAKRLHHQLLPMRVSYDADFDPVIIEALTNIGHIVFERSFDQGFAALTAISQNQNNIIDAVYDPRRGGSAIVF